MKHRNDRRASRNRNRKRNPSGLAIGASLLALGIGGVVLRDILKKDSPPSKLPPGGGGGTITPTDPVVPVEPSVSDYPIGSVFVRRQIGALNLEMSKGTVSKGMVSMVIDNSADRVTANPSSYPFDMLISLANEVDSDGTVSYDGDVEIVDGQPGGRDILVRFYAPATFNFRAGARDEYAPGYSQSTNEPFEIVAI